MIQENRDDSVQRDVIDLLRKLIPQGVWQHDVQDGVVVIFEVIGWMDSSVIIPISTVFLVT